jgi:hypothetical protein
VAVIGGEEEEEEEEEEADVIEITNTKKVSKSRAAL